MKDQTEKFDSWAVVELFGHVRLAGRVSEQVIAGQGFIRVDVPVEEDSPETFTRLFGPGAIYSINPCAEQIARAFAEVEAGPVNAYDMGMLMRRLEHKTERELPLEDQEEDSF